MLLDLIRDNSHSSGNIWTFQYHGKFKFYFVICVFFIGGLQVTAILHQLQLQLVVSEIIPFCVGSHFCSNCEFCRIRDLRKFILECCFHT